jgi:hypothetical protein
MSLTHWLITLTSSQATRVEVVATDHSEGPRGQVPEQAQQTVEESDAWIGEALFGMKWTPDMCLEIEALDDDWQPLSWVHGPCSRP